MIRFTDKKLLASVNCLRIRAHLKWTPVIMLGYTACIVCPLLINARLM
jgi:hypothetical protein